MFHNQGERAPMSHRHIAKPKPPQPAIARWKLALGAAICIVLVLGLWIAVNWTRSIPQTYATTNGKIIEIRRVVDSTADSNFGGRIVYGFEARVQFTINGQAQERWLRASDNVPRETLALKLASHPTECLVYWPPSHPESARCWPK
jgi:hypothetical protein